LPTILIGDSRLGGISSTISSYEALLLRGLIVDAVILFRDDRYRNWEYLASYFNKRSVRLSVISPPPPILPSPEDNAAYTEKYYEQAVLEDGTMQALQKVLDEKHSSRIAELDSMQGRAFQSVWWPFVQHGLMKSEDVMVIDSSNSDFFSVYKDSDTPVDGAPESLLHHKFDGSASWWTQALGHAAPNLTLAAAGAAGRYGHVMFPKAIHKPALDLTERLLRSDANNNWASRVFFSDNGSTGMEVALKMALRAYSVAHNLDQVARKSLGVLGLKNSYHGDTIGAMDACEPSVYTCEWHNAKGFWLDYPTVGVANERPQLFFPQSMGRAASLSPEVKVFPSLSAIYDVESRLSSELAELYLTHIQTSLDVIASDSNVRVGALVLEPLVMGAGGMHFVDPLYQRVLIEVIRGNMGTVSPSLRGLPVIFDEVFVGLYRLGMESTSSVLGTLPDIAVYAKILTGGLLPLSVTLASDKIFRAFGGERKVDALLHGHSYTAHAVGCAVANETFKSIDALHSSEAWRKSKNAWSMASDSLIREPRVWSFWDPQFIQRLSRHESVEKVMALGTVLAFKFNLDEVGGRCLSCDSVHN
jgi:bifunctional dethiobiotin synthetase / adenosylmethionine---8-amino-7-oxononanoate aminotransferase